MTLFNLFALFITVSITAIIAAFRGHWEEFVFLLGLDFAVGFATYMTLLSA